MYTVLILLWIDLLYYVQLKYLYYLCLITAFKESKKNLISVLNDGEKSRHDDLLPSSLDFPQESKRKTTCVLFLQSIGVDLDDTSSDMIKEERLRRADQRTQSMSYKYVVSVVVKDLSGIRKMLKLLKYMFSFKQLSILFVFISLLLSM